jgi:cell fate regulator YaaT (PSP1 superfamily)
MERGNLKNIVGIKFRKDGKTYNFDAADLQLAKNDHVIVNTENGPSWGTVFTPVTLVPINKLPAGLKSVIRKVTEEDFWIKRENETLEQESRQFCLEKIKERALPMKLIDVECLFDKSQIVFYFTAESRVDFRELVKDLVQQFKMRIELRQIGARHEARMIGGLGICGREVCCANSIPNLDRVSVKMAKEQSVSLNPEKISGLCGRLMCCLAFEFEGYQDMKKHVPKCGKVINAPEGRGKIVRQNILKGEVVVQLESGKEVTVNIKDL